MSEVKKGYVHYAHYKKNGEIMYFEHIDVGYDYEKEYRLLHTAIGVENLTTYLKMVKGAEEILDFGIKEVDIRKKQIAEGIIEENGGQTAEEFAVVLKQEGKEAIEIEDYLQRYFMNQKVRITIEFLD